MIAVRYGNIVGKKKNLKRFDISILCGTFSTAFYLWNESAKKEIRFHVARDLFPLY